MNRWIAYGLMPWVIAGTSIAAAQIHAPKPGIYCETPGELLYWDPKDYNASFTRDGTVIRQGGSLKGKWIAEFGPSGAGRYIDT